jgi:DNA-binding NarL/FixJ family response regulator
MSREPARKRSRPRLLLVDDHHLILAGLRIDLGKDYEIVGELHSGAEVLGECQKLEPDAVLLDVSLPDQSGLEVIVDLRSAGLTTRILLVSMHTDRTLADAAIQRGANGYVPKDASATELLHALTEVLAGRTYISPLLVKRDPLHSATDVALGLSLLSPHQRQIVSLLGEGKSTEQIAAVMGLSANTITYHRVRIRKILGIANEWGLMRYAMEVKLTNDR